MVTRRSEQAAAPVEPSPPAKPQVPPLLQKLRNTWEFANLFQFIYIFGKALKIEERLSIEDLERECCKPETSRVLSDIGLALLKSVSSHRGLTPDLFDEYTRRQYVAKVPSRNPFGEDEEPRKFATLDIFTKLRVLVQLSEWTLNNPERVRERMDEHTETEQASSWRVGEIGWDRHDRTYFVLDDNRLYRRTDPEPEAAPPPDKKKPKNKAAKNFRPRPAGARTSSRRHTGGHEPVAEEVNGNDNGPEEQSAEPEMTEEQAGESKEENTFGGYKWKCVAITLQEYRDFLVSIQGSRHPDEKALHQALTEDVMPVIEFSEASLVRRRQKEERELFHMQLLAGAKRSSRIEAKIERDRQEKEAAEAAEKRMAEAAEAKRQAAQQRKIDQERESRMKTRELRLKERETRRILHEQDLAKMSEEEQKLDKGESRVSERHLKAEMERKKQELAALEEEEDWTFDCSKCGKFGVNYDDGSHSVACERCNIWQHSACLGISEAAAEADDFHFVCADCKRREEDAKKPKIPTLKFRLGSSPPDQKVKPVSPEGTVTKRKHADTEIASPSAPKKLKHENVNSAHAESPRVSQDGLAAAAAAAAALAAQQVQIPFPQPNVQAHSATTHQSPRPIANGYQHQSIMQQPAPPSNSTASRAPPPSQSPKPGWSAQYVPPNTNAYSPSSHGLPPADHNPFANSLNDPPRPSPRSSSSSNMPQVNGHGHAHAHPRPVNPQTPSNSFPTAPRQLSASSTPQVNGYAIAGLGNDKSIGLPSMSPVKNASPPLAPSPPTLPPAPSPTASQQSLIPQAVGALGISPIKQSPPANNAVGSHHAGPLTAPAFEPEPNANVAPGAVSNRSPAASAFSQQFFQASQPIQPSQAALANTKAQFSPPSTRCNPPQQFKTPAAALVQSPAKHTLNITAPSAPPAAVAERSSDQLDKMAIDTPPSHTQTAQTQEQTQGQIRPQTQALGQQQTRTHPQA